MGARTSPRPPFLQAILFSLAFFAAWCVVVGFVLVSATSAELRLKSEYDSAPACSSAAAISGCRFEGKAPLLRIYYLNGRWRADVAIEDIRGSYSADFLSVDSSTVTTWPSNSVLPVELWKGQLVRVGGLRTVANPDAFAHPYLLVVGFVIVGVGVILAAVFAWQLVLFRATLRQRARKLAGEDPAVEVLPLTPAMREHLGRSRGASRDLERGVFVRESGAFDVRKTPLKGFETAVIVSIGGRSLRPLISERAERIPSGTGKVDYFSATGELMALWDSSGNLLWARLSN